MLQLSYFVCLVKLNIRLLYFIFESRQIGGFMKQKYGAEYLFLKSLSLLK